MLKQEYIEYKDGDVTLNGYMAWDDKIHTQRPAVLVAPDWSGQNDFARHKANQLALLGYVGFALDMYGNGKTGATKEEKSALIEPLMQDREKLKNRILAGFNTVKTLDTVDSKLIGAIGFCFGGLCVLDLARSGADLKGVVSFHGLLHAPENVTQQTIKAKILALHGYDDPMGTPDHVIAFCNEMTDARANWELDMYGNTMHAFTNPEAHDVDFGTVYDKQADARSWISMVNFFKEVLV